MLFGMINILLHEYSGNMKIYSGNTSSNLTYHHAISTYTRVVRYVMVIVRYLKGIRLKQ